MLTHVLPLYGLSFPHPHRGHIQYFLGSLVQRVSPQMGQNVYQWSIFFTGSGSGTPPQAVLELDRRLSTRASYLPSRLGEP